MAIAYDSYAIGTAGAGSSLTYSHTCTGSDLILFVSVFIQTSLTITGITYNGVALTSIDGQTNGASNERIELWYLIAPATGANNIVISRSGSTGALQGRSTSYTGANQSSQPDASSKSIATSTTLTDTVTTVADNCWAVWVIRNGVGSFSNYTGWTRRSSNSSVELGDSNSAKTPAGNLTFTADPPSSTEVYDVMASFSPSVVASTFTPKVIII
jgi:hypothetical protein